MEGVKNISSKRLRRMGPCSSLSSVVFLDCVDCFYLNPYTSQHIFLRYIYFMEFIFEACHVTIQWESIHIITLITIAFKPKHTYIKNV